VMALGTARPSQERRADLRGLQALHARPMAGASTGPRSSTPTRTRTIRG
jgi:hypothetical protein